MRTPGLYQNDAGSFLSYPVEHRRRRHWRRLAAAAAAALAATPGSSRRCFCSRLRLGQRGGRCSRQRHRAAAPAPPGSTLQEDVARWPSAGKAAAIPSSSADMMATSGDSSCGHPGEDHGQCSVSHLHGSSRRMGDASPSLATPGMDLGGEVSSSAPGGGGGGEASLPPGAPILMETGREDITSCALADGSSFVCERCGGVVPVARRLQHERFWCQ